MVEIWKFPLSEASRQEVEMPKFALILSLKVLEERPYIYAVVDTSKLSKVSRVFRTYATGEEMVKEGRQMIVLDHSEKHRLKDFHPTEDALALLYWGTYRTDGKEPFVGHVFEELDVEGL